MKKTKKFKPLKNLALKYNNVIVNKIPTRIHMSIILMSVALSGTLISKILLELGMNTLWIRYLITAISCYAFFILYMKLWLLYINPGKNSPRSNSSSQIDLSGIDLDGNISSGSSSSETVELLGKGGNFGGAGASSSFEGNIIMPMQSTSISPNTSSDFSDFSLDLDIDGEAVGPLLIVLAVGAVVLAIFGGAVFIIYQAPAIMSEAAFETLLVSGFLKSARDISSGDWVGSILKRTWIPFAIIVLVATLAGWVIGYFCPLAIRIMDIQSCI